MIYFSNYNNKQQYYLGMSFNINNIKLHAVILNVNSYITGSISSIFQNTLCDSSLGSNLTLWDSPSHMLSFHYIYTSIDFFGYMKYSTVLRNWIDNDVFYNKFMIDIVYRSNIFIANKKYPKGLTVGSSEPYCLLHISSLILNNKPNQMFDSAIDSY